MCIPQWLHHGSRVGTSYKITTLAFLGQYMKCYLSLRSTFISFIFTCRLNEMKVNTLGKDITYVSGTPPPTSTPQVRGTNTLWDISMWWRSDKYSNDLHHSLQLTLVFFRSLSMTPYPVALCLYVVSPVSLK